MTDCRGPSEFPRLRSGFRLRGSDARKTAQLRLTLTPVALGFRSGLGRLSLVTPPPPFSHALELVKLDLDSKHKVK